MVIARAPGGETLRKNVRHAPFTPDDPPSICEDSRATWPHAPALPVVVATHRPHAAGLSLPIHLASVIVGRLLIGKTGRFVQLFFPNRQSPRVSVVRAFFQGTRATCQLLTRPRL